MKGRRRLDWYVHKQAFEMMMMTKIGTADQREQQLYDQVQQLD